MLWKDGVKPINQVSDREERLGKSIWAGRSQHGQGRTQSRDVVRVIVWVVIALSIGFGIALRVDGLKAQEYFFDEHITSVFVSGQPADRASRKLRIPSDSSKYEHLAPNTSIATVVKNLTMYGADQGPVYYVLARLWAEATGGDCSGEAIRPLSLIFGLLLIPAFYWLGYELLGTPIAGAVGAALMAIMPFNIFWAQHARPYSLWGLLAVASSIFLVRAVRSGTLSNWIIFAVCTVCATYTHLLTVLLVVAQAAYVLTLEKFKASKCTLSFAMAVGAVGLSFLFWVPFLRAGSYSAPEASVHWMFVSLPLFDLVNRFCQRVGQAIFDLNCLNLGFFPLLAILLVIALSCVRLSRNAEKNARIFVVSLMVTPLLCLLVRDLETGIFEGRTYSLNRVEGSFTILIDRYLVPTLLGLQLVIAFWISSALNSKNRLARTLVASIFALLVSISMVSTVSSHSGSQPDLRSMARIVNNSHSKILVVSSNLAFPLCRHLDSDIQILGVEKDKLPEALNSKSEFFVLASRNLIRSLSNLGTRKIRSCACQPKKMLWRVKGTASTGGTVQTRLEK